MPPKETIDAIDERLKALDEKVSTLATADSVRELEKKFLTLSASERIFALDKKVSTLATGESVRALEDGALKLKIWLQVAAGVIVSLGLSLGGVVHLLDGARGKIVKVQSEADAMAERLQGLDGEITTKIAAAVNGDILAATYKPTSVLAQIQAQAICTSLADPGMTVMAVFRHPVDKRTREDGSHVAVTNTCTTICDLQKGNDNKPLTYFRGVALFKTRPFTYSGEGVHSGGLMSYTHDTNLDSDEYGPSYCCCSG